MLLELPEHVANQATDLGDPIARFETSRVQMLLCVFLGGLFVLSGACVLAVIPRIDQAGSTIKLLLFGVLLDGTGVGLLGRWRSLRGTGVCVFAEGIVRHDRVKCESVRWDRIHEVRRGDPAGHPQLTMATPARLALTDDEGREWVFTEARTGSKEFRAIAEERTLHYMLPAALEALARDRTLRFGSVGITRAGLTFPSLSWEDMTRADLEAGKLVVRSRPARGKHLELPVREVPNAHLLLALIGRFTKGEA